MMYSVGITTAIIIVMADGILMTIVAIISAITVLTIYICIKVKPNPRATCTVVHDHIADDMISSIHGHAIDDIYDDATHAIDDLTSSVHVQSSIYAPHTHGQASDDGMTPTAVTNTM